MELATALIDKRTAKFDPGKFHDRYEDALRALIDAKRGKATAEVENDEPAPKASNVIDLMAALKASIEKGGGSPRPRAADGDAAQAEDGGETGGEGPGAEARVSGGQAAASRREGGRATTTPDPLATYAAKRDFAKTAEPAGGAPTAAGNSFIVQKHAASRLHWDFRLELDGVLVSWAVTKPPSTDPAVKRLAVRTEDHPLDYATFEGTIPKGEYGGGTVMLWDRGTWTNESDPAAGLAKGKLHFTLTGERMRGEWVLIRLKPEGKAENWLLGKIEDEFATGVDLDFDASIATGRTMAAIAAGGALRTNARRHPGESRDPVARGVARPRHRVPACAGMTGRRSERQAPPPAFREPQLATLVDRPPPGNDWLHETKYDGYRAQVAVGGGAAVAYSRSGLDWTDRFGAVPAACAALPCASALIDGEIVALDGSGKPNFSTLQANLKDGGPLLYFAFDLLELDGDDLAPLPLTERKAKLAALLDGAPPPLHYSEHVRGGGEAMFAALCGNGYEGVVSKRADGVSRAGPVGVVAQGEMHPPAGVRHRRLVEVGQGPRLRLAAARRADEDGGLRYAGRVGTGFTDRTLDESAAKLDALKADKSPFAGKLDAAARRGATFVRPELVAEIAFAEFTADGSVRHASFLGLREDKAADAVVAEAPAAAPTPDRHGVRVTSPDRVVFPELGLTKGGAGRLLRRRRRRHAQGTRQPADQPRPLPAGARQDVLLPEARQRHVLRRRPPRRHRRVGRQDRAVPVRRQRRRAAQLRPDGDDRVPRLGQPRRRHRAPRPAGDRPRPRRRARLQRGQDRRRPRPRPAQGEAGWRASRC